MDTGNYGELGFFIVDSVSGLSFIRWSWRTEATILKCSSYPFKFNGTLYKVVSRLVDSSYASTVSLSIKNSLGYTVTDGSAISLPNNSDYTKLLFHSHSTNKWSPIVVCGEHSLLMTSSGSVTYGVTELWYYKDKFKRTIH